MTADSLSLTLEEAAAALARKDLSSVEMTTAAVDRMEAQQPALNMLAGLDREDALRQAADSDARRAKDDMRGPLEGVPLAHKDMYYRAGRISACGSNIRKDFVPDVTATALSRLDATGALDIARLNMVEFALGPTGHNELTGTPGNPWNPPHLPGGSSSGPASSVAARQVFGTLGSDTGGSIRLPSACCGLVGIKPTYGRVSRFGAMPLSFSLDHVGPLARNARDCAVLLGAIAGRDPEDPTTLDAPVPDYLDEIEVGVRGLKVGLPDRYFDEGTHPEVQALLDDALSVFKALGAETVPVTLPDGFEAANDLNNVILRAEAAALHRPMLESRPGDYGQQTYERMMPGLHQSAVGYIDALRLRGVLCDAMLSEVFDKADVLFTPTIQDPIPRTDETDFDRNPDFFAWVGRFARCVRVFNFTGLPALSAPIGFTGNGLPASMQLIGRPLDEPTLLRAARAYERETAWTGMAPPL